jgi:apolipoprotein N-acyltransferase
MSAIGSAVLCGLTLPPIGWWPLAPVALAPLAVALSRSSVAGAAWLGLLHGVLTNGFATYWIIPPLCDLAGLPIPGSLAVFLTLVVFQGVRTAVGGALAALGNRCGLPQTVAFPAALVSAELCYPLVLPWYLALFAQGCPTWVQLASVGGPLLVSFWIAVVGAALGAAALADDRRRRLTALALAIGVLATVTAWGTTRLQMIDREVARAPVARIGVVQGNLDAAVAERRDPLERYRALTRELSARAPDLDLIVWPETAVSRPVRDSHLGELVADEISSARPSRGPGRGPALLLGVVTEGDVSGAPVGSPLGDGRLRNSAVLVDPHGAILGRYDKRELIPIGEDSALSFLGLRAVTAFTRGEPRPAPAVLGHRLGLSICYEDMLYRAFARLVHEQQPELLVNLTSDVWFRGSPGPSLHLALASLRAVEQGRFLLRATTTGVSALVDPGGRVVWRLPENARTTGVAEPRWLTTRTAYSQIGDRGWALAAPLFWLWALWRRRSRVTGSSPRTSPRRDRST